MNPEAWQGLAPSRPGRAPARQSRIRHRPVTAVLMAALAVAAASLLAACGGSSSPGGASAQPAKAWPGVVSTGTVSGPGEPSAPADQAVYTQRGSNSRVGWDYHETALTTRDVKVSGFGKLAAFPVTGKIYGQPLFVPGLRIGGVTRNVVIVTTEDDQVYAFDADATGSQPALLWHTNFLVHGATAVSSAGVTHCPFIKPTIGITGTPVIDRATGSIYLVTATEQNGHPVDAIHALSITTGHDTFTPQVIKGSVKGNGEGSSHGVLSFSALHGNEHAALLLNRGVVYVAMSSYCDFSPEHGWIFGYNARNLHQSVLWNTTPSGSQGYDGAIWQAAMGMVADPAGHMYVMTANGGFNLNTGGPDAADSLLELARQGGTLKVVDYFTPYYQQCLNYHDEDYGSSGPLLMPHEIIAIGKTGAIEVLNRAHLGGYVAIKNPCANQNLTTVDHAIQEFPQGTIAGGNWSDETYWQGKDGTFVYTGGEADHVKAWKLVNGKLVYPPSSQAPESMAYPGTVPMGTSNGGNPATAIVWALDDEKGAALRAFSAANLSHELWNSLQDPSRDGLPKAGDDYYTLPTFVGSRVYLGTNGELMVYGLLRQRR